MRSKILGGGGGGLVGKLCLTLCDPMDCSLPGSSVRFPRQEYWSGLPFPPRDLPHPGIKPTSPASQVDSLLPLSHHGNLLTCSQSIFPQRITVQWRNWTIPLLNHN